MASSRHDFWFTHIPVPRDEDLLASLHPVCNFTSAFDIGHPPAYEYFVIVLAVIFSIVLIVPIPFVIARRKLFPLSLRSIPLMFSLALSLLFQEMTIIWSELYGRSIYPCRIFAIQRNYIAPLTFVTIITELLRITMKTQHADAVQRLEAETNPEAKKKYMLEVKRAKKRFGWKTDVQAMIICLLPTTIFFVLRIAPEPTMVHGCVGCNLYENEAPAMVLMALLCIAVSAYLMFKLRHYGDESGLKRDIRTIILVSFVMMAVLVPLAFLLEDKAPFVPAATPLLLVASFRSYIYTIKPLLLTYPAMQNWVLQRRKKRIERRRKKRAGKSSVAAAPAKANTSMEMTSVNLEQVLTFKDSLILFKQHMSAEFCLELVAFWEAAKKWVNAFDSTNIDVQGAVEIYENYIANSAPLQVNLNCDNFSNLSKVFRGSGSSIVVSQNVFDAALLETFHLMETDVFVRFKATDRYRLCIEALQKGVNGPKNARKSTKFSLSVSLRNVADSVSKFGNNDSVKSFGASYVPQGMTPSTSANNLNAKTGVMKLTPLNDGQ